MQQRNDGKHVVLWMWISKTKDYLGNIAIKLDEEMAAVSQWMAAVYAEGRRKGMT